MNGRVNHLILNVNPYDEAKRFYGRLLPRLGYPNQKAYADHAPRRRSGWYNDAAPFGCWRRNPLSRRPIPSAPRGTLRNRLHRKDSRHRVDELAAEIEGTAAG